MPSSAVIVRAAQVLVLGTLLLMGAGFIIENSAPEVPRASIGLVVPHFRHGATVYLTQGQALFLNLTQIAVIACVPLFFAAVLYLVLRQRISPKTPSDLVE